MKGNRFSYSLAVATAAVLPKPASRLIAKNVAALYSATSADSRIIKDNLRQALGPLPEAELDRRAREIVRNFAYFLVDLFYSRELADGFVERRVRFRGREFLDRALAEKKGAILVSAHVGNWELGGMALARLGYPVHAVALRHRDPWVNAFFQDLRSKNRLNILLFGSFLKGCYRTLKKNEVLALNGDRLFSAKGIPVQFFGKKVSFPSGPARISLSTGAPALPCFFFVDGDSYLLDIQKPLRSRDEVGLAQEFAAILEAEIRQRPTQWLIFQRFWEKAAWPV